MQGLDLNMREKLIATWAKSGGKFAWVRFFSDTLNLLRTNGMLRGFACLSREP